jgi:hypothetical protein
MRHIQCTAIAFSALQCCKVTIHLPTERIAPEGMHAAVWEGGQRLQLALLSLLLLLLKSPEPAHAHAQPAGVTT